ncbi:MAG: tyrosine-type recombinase/integrase [Burkholderiales bacterium]|nr:tyrosine-type recombinase/integrase [Burkholderiales bacterium]
MATQITDKGMQAKPGADDTWLAQPFKRGAGVFMGRITPTGERLFYFRYSDPDGKRPFLPIGPYHPKGKGGLTLAEAYAKACELSGMLQSGIKDLKAHLERERLAAIAIQEAEIAERNRAKSAAAALAEAQARRLTLEQLFQQWQRAELTPKLLADGTRIGRKDGGAWVKQSFDRRVFPRLGHLAVADIKRADLLEILDEVKTEGKLRTATVLYADMRQMLRFAVEREVIPFNPLDGIKRSKIGGKATERKRVLSDEELRLLWNAVPNARMHPRSAAAIWLVLATATRVGEAMGARWDDIDLAAQTWHLPTTKNQRDHTVSLSAFAVERLRELAAVREAGPDGKPSPWVFPNTSRDNAVCIKSFGKQLADRQRTAGQRLANRTKLTDSLALPGGKWTAHDLRRTAATMMARLGISTDVIDECLNHKLQSRVAKVYVHDRRLADQARAFEALGDKLDELFAARECEDNVYTLYASR